MYSNTFSTLIIMGVLCFAASVYGSGLCTGYPKMYNGKHCASTTRYWDGQMGACGCGTSNTDPFSWQWTKPTAAASAPIYGSGTWCGSGCGKCYKLTPTGVGASVAGKGSPNVNPLVVKVSNLCPYSGNEEWCAVDVNTHDYDAHFDLMDQNMNGIITAQGWDNPEVTYEEVDCAANGFPEWSCQCASGGTTTPISGATTKPITGATTKPTTTTTQAPTTTTKAPATTTKASTTTTKAPVTTTTNAPTKTPIISTNAPAVTTTAAASSSTPIKITLKPGVSSWWIGFESDAAYTKVEIMDNNGAFPNWFVMSYHGDQYWGMFYANPASEMKLPLSFRFTNAAGKSVVASKVVTTWSGPNGGVITTSVSL